MEEIKKSADQQDKARLVLGTMLDSLGLEADLQVEEKGNKLVVKITSPDAGRIIGRRGVTLESLQLLLNRIMFKGEEDAPLIALDIDGYLRGNTGRGERSERKNDGDRRERGGDRRERGDRDDRRERGDRGDRDDRRERGGKRGDSVPEEELRQLALDKAKEVKRWGEAIELAPMNAHDRRIIHINLKDDPEIETCSDGEGAMKKVVISLKKAENAEN